MSTALEPRPGEYLPSAPVAQSPPTLTNKVWRRRWIILIALVACAPLIVLANYLIDPYCAYGARLPSLLDYKPGYDRPQVKAELVASLKPTALILGASRALVFDPRWSGWGPYGAFNLGMAPASMEQIAQAFKFAAAQGRVERALLCIDMVSFGHDEPYRDYNESRFSPRYSPTTHNIENLLSLHACSDSFGTLWRYFNHQPSDYTVLGDARGGKVRYAGPARPHFVASLKELQKKFSQYRRNNEAMTALRETVRLCRERNMELTVVVPPVHALYLETLASLDLSGDYETWLQDVTNVVSDESSGKFAVWDFAGYNRYTTEAPPQNDRSPDQQYYQGASLFTRALANKVLARVYDTADAEDDFGVQLKPADVDVRIEQLHSERAAWLAEQPEALSLLGAVFPARRLDGPDAPRAARR